MPPPACLLQLDRQWYTVSISYWSWFCKVCIDLRVRLLKEETVACNDVYSRVTIKKTYCVLFYLVGSG
uniref:Uncharacterized protein n=1 Tax=Hyaloperonospora arabidopsidis (strain Emoy2) TaxID=559515 RepID=M4BMV7_HYAAE